MAGLIPQPFIDEVLDRVDIAEVVGSRIDLKRTGKNHKACCPFHNEKTPSFTINADKQFYYCFGCGAGGNAIGFLMDYERMEFPQAVESLAHACGLEVPREDTPNAKPQASNKPLYTALERCTAVYKKQLKTSKPAVDYLKARGLTGEIAKAYAIGFAPPGWDNLQALCGKAIATNTLELAGMLIRKDDGRSHYDRFRDRIMFPIRDIRGRVIAFGGRVMGNDVPKYLNSPETPVFNKSKELYGLYEARQTNRNLQRVVVVEGYMDVIALAQFGITYAAATLGTAVGSTHLERIFKQTSEVIFCFDGDNAGRAAAARALIAALPEMKDGRQAWFLFLPDGHDPDSVVRESGQAGFESMLDNATPLSEFLFDHAAANLNLATIDGRARLTKSAVPLIQQLPEGAFKQLMEGELANRTGLDRTEVSAMSVAPEKPATPTYATNNVMPPTQPSNSPENEHYAPNYEDGYEPLEAYPDDTIIAQPLQREALASQHATTSLTSMRKAAALLLFNPELAVELEIEAPERSGDIMSELFFDLLTTVRSHPDVSSHTLIGYWLNTNNPAKKEAANSLLAVEKLLPNRNIKAELEETLRNYRSQEEKHRIHNAMLSLQSVPFSSMSEEQKQQYRSLQGELLQHQHKTKH